MMPAKHQSGLGRGLGELFQRTDVDEEPRRPRESEVDHEADPSKPLEDGSYFQLIPVDQIRPNPKQPRTVFDEEALNELIESIKEVGVLQPIVVRKVDHDQFELIMGERRWRATTAAGLERVPAIVRGTDDGDLLRDALLENLHRAQLNPLEEAAAYQQMLSDFGCTQEELAAKIKRSRPQISNTIRLLRLPVAVQRRVAAGALSAGHARALLMVDDPERQEELAQRIVSEGLSVRATEELVASADPTDEAPRRQRSAKQPSPRAQELSSVLSDHFDAKVKVDIGKKKSGRITIEFATEDDLERILNVVNAS